MNKSAYLARLRQLLGQLAEEELNQTVGFYAEMIDDRIEEGMSEADAVAGMEPPEQLAERILMDMPMGALLKNKARRQAQKHESMPGWAKALLIILAVLAIPVWLPLLLAVAGVAFAIFVTIWALIVAIIAVVVSVGIGAVAAVVAAVVLLFVKPMSGLAMLGCALVLCGVAILAWFLCRWIVKGLVALSKLTWRGIKSLFVKKEREEAATHEEEH